MRLLLAALLILLAVPAAAQESECSNISRAGMTSEIKITSVDDLLQMPENYYDRAVRTEGRLEMDPRFTGGHGIQYGLRGQLQSGLILLYPSPEASAMWDDDMRKASGRDLEVTGIVKQTRDEENVLTGRRLSMLVCGYVLPPDEKAKGVKGLGVTLEQLNEAPDRYVGRLVTVEGEFRGANLFGDMPPSTRGIRSDDWVIKDDVWSAWVTGRKPKGQGWSLDVGMKRDAGKWLRVTGRLREGLGQTVVIQATDVELIKAKTGGMVVPTAPPTPTKPAKPRKPPMIVFSLPIDGDTTADPTTTELIIQFNADLDEASLDGHVVARYFGEERAGDRPFVLAVTYDEPRALHVAFGDLLQLGRTVEVILLPGILDLDGRPLAGRPDPATPAPEGAVDAIRFRTGVYR